MLQCNYFIYSEENPIIIDYDVNTRNKSVADVLGGIVAGKVRKSFGFTEQVNGIFFAFAIRYSGKLQACYFNPTDNITRAEAAVILNSIIGAEASDAVPVFADEGTVPAWAKSSVYALTAAGVFSGTGNRNFSANDAVSRAEVAQMLLKVKKIFVD